MRQIAIFVFVMSLVFFLIGLFEWSKAREAAHWPGRAAQITSAEVRKAADDGGSWVALEGIFVDEVEHGHPDPRSRRDRIIGVRQRDDHAHGTGFIGRRGRLYGGRHPVPDRGALALALVEAESMTAENFCAPPAGDTVISNARR
jgi:hypothetical protein